MRKFRRIENDSFYGTGFIELTEVAYCCSSGMTYPNPEEWNDEYEPPTLIEIQDFIDWLEQQTAYAWALKARIRKEFP